MFILSWMKGLFTYRSSRLWCAMVGVALTVGLLASTGTFIASGAASMTKHAVAGVPVDWQVQLAPGASVGAVKKAVSQTVFYSALEQVGYADVSGFTAATGGTVQTTGPGKVLGISDSYIRSFPAELRRLTGAAQGVLVAQQTAANLHVQAGDTVVMQRIGLPAAKVKVAGVVDLPDADALFQAVGAPPGAAPQAPPDNVVLLPAPLWHSLFDGQAGLRPDTVRTQLHVKLAQPLPSAPSDAYIYVQRLANNLEARLAGSGLVGDNLAARLAGVREDALYGRVLFLFLGLPGVLLAMWLTLAVTASGAARRRREQALLRVRGAAIGQIMGLAVLEALVVAFGGVLLGTVLALGTDKLILPAGVLVHKQIITWTVGAAIAGLVLAAVAVLYPAWVQARHLAVLAGRAPLGRAGVPLWQRAYVDLIILAAGAVELWHTAGTGYQLVLAPEGVASVSVHYEAFLAPLCLWLGGMLLISRLGEGFLKHGRGWLAKTLKPAAQKLSGLVAAYLCRQRGLVTRGMVLVALAVSFAVSTSVFNTTYNAQSRVDAELTNGADVTVTGSTTAPAGSRLAALQALPGVAAAQSMIHRFAYVGSDLQDIYGINPLQIGKVTSISNSYFGGGNARATLAALARQPDGVLVSEETVRDFQLHPGDLLRLRLQNSRDHSYHPVTFHFVGVVREFPTAPRDSFLVANASYLARVTGNDASEIVLMRSTGNPAALAARARPVVSSLAGARVTDIGSAQRLISSNLTAVNLRGLTRLELAFAVLLVAAATGLILALGLSERRRTLALLAALGARGRQLGAFIWSEGLVMLIGGTLLGTVLGFGIALTLVKVLTGVFDPPPEFITVPWGYLGLLLAAAVTSTAAAVLGIKTAAARPASQELRNLL
ncbi:FtsX-like permease family protein [Desulfotruncus alcoholivorax]|uniref:FtsX-like permease family protein n=1 Tax=Desulfotruncus alcoholivorax TaxID=265477 RepID=UPI0005532534|nr:FtsX-like permease family protein [Desulfotruncus alcoholivorax]